MSEEKLKAITFPLIGGAVWRAAWDPKDGSPVPVSYDLSGLKIEHLAHGLANVVRFCGQTPHPYSVGQHSIILARYAKKIGHSDEFCRYCLVHDCPEALGVADAHGALKKLIAQPTRLFEADLMEKVWWWLERTYLPPGFVENCKRLDQLLGNYEAYMFGFPHEPAPAEGWPVFGWFPYQADVKERFLEAWQLYGGKI